MPAITPSLTSTRRDKFKLVTQKIYVELFIQSGLSQRAFCEQYKLNKCTFKNWVFRHKSAAKSLSPHPVFYPLNLLDDIGVESDDDSDDCTKTKVTSPNLAHQSLKLCSSLANNASDPYTATITHKALTVSIHSGFDPLYLRQILQIVVAL